jgi:hypothetical protein
MKRKYQGDGFSDDQYCYGRLLPLIKRLRRWFPWL